MRLRTIAAALALLTVSACADAPTTPEAVPSTRRSVASAPSVYLTGPSWVTYGTMYTPGPPYQWTAHASGGNGTYSYQWHISDVLGRSWNPGVAGPVFETGFDCRWVNFELTVYVTSGGQTTSASTWVEGLGDGQCEG
jgi:hypothetical protein